MFSSIMTSLLAKIKELFISKEKKFIIALNEELENKNFVNLKKISSKLSLQQRYNIINKLQSSKELHGVLLVERMLFLSIDEDDLNDLKDKIKNIGTIELPELKERWKLKDNILDNLLQHIEKGVMGEKAFYTHRYLQHHFVASLTKSDEHDLIQMSSKLGLEPSIILPFVQKMITEETVSGVIKQQQFFVDSESFETSFSEYLEEMDESALEKEFSEVAIELGVSSSVVEKYLVKYVERVPGRFVVYPLEKKVRIKR
ncbi:MAG: hypothetical protein H7647_08240 [Candidatus Heimdallarchaeota archaeon]|nr:hypothetical protein [Candidatus Heimdallarchaeota archaeon]